MSGFKALLQPASVIASLVGVTTEDVGGGGLVPH